MYSPLEAGVNVFLFEDSNPTNFGSPLLDLIEEDWSVFSERLVEGRGASDLLEDIVNIDWDDDSGESPVNRHELYTRHGPWFHTSLEEHWAEFRARVRGKPELKPDFHELFGEDITRTQTEVKQGTILYRARPDFAVDGNGKTVPFDGSEIGAPPTDKALPSRASPEGKRVLYCADNPRIAIAEIRPQTRAGRFRGQNAGDEGFADS
jgi:hypothetical protein